MWFFWALFSALTAAIRRPIEKPAINRLHHFSFGFSKLLLSLPLIMAVAMFESAWLNPLRLSWNFWLPTLVSSVIFWPLGMYLYTGAIGRGELSKVMPIQSLAPVVSLLIAWIFVGEVPTLVSAAGLFLTVAGVYALGLKGRRLHHPLQPFREDKSSLFMLLGTLLFALTGPLDKTAIRASNPLFYSLAMSSIACLVSYIGLRLSGRRVVDEVGPVWRRLGIIGSLEGLTFTSYLLAIAAGPIAYVSAVRGSNVMMGALIGIVWLHEKLTAPKAISFGLIVLGAVLLVFGA